MRRDRRGQGLGTTATTAVARTLVEMGIRTIALNVAQTNAVAIRAYERVGFRKYCEFYEGVAVAAV
ncbi:MAG TPA: GNAT family N-acetyltransferase [Armatimonadota bacterium]|nr:GNAT family N-acetyltransferase [Armatimonadota bacterium]